MGKLYDDKKKTTTKHDWCECIAACVSVKEFYTATEIVDSNKNKYGSIFTYMYVRIVCVPVPYLVQCITINYIRAIGDLAERGTKMKIDVNIKIYIFI